MNQKGFVSIIVAIVITVLIVGGSVYYYQEMQKDKTVDQTVKELSGQANSEINKLKNEVAELKEELASKEENDIEEIKRATYTDPDFGYSFTYLESWVQEDHVLSFTDIEYSEMGTSNAPISFGLYSDEVDVDGILSFSKIQYYLDNAERRVEDSYVKTGEDKEFDFYSLIDPGSYEGDSAGNVYIAVSRDSLFDDKDVRLVFKWEEKPGGKNLEGNNAQEFLHILATIKFEAKDFVSDWQTYTNDHWNFSFQYPNDWHILSDGEAGMSAGVALGDNPLMILKINPDGFGPHFPDKSYELEKANGGLIIVNEETHAPNANNDDEYYQIIAGEDGNPSSPYFWMSFTDKTTDKEAWEAIAKKIIGSLVFLD